MVQHLSERMTGNLFIIIRCAFTHKNYSHFYLIFIAFFYKLKILLHFNIHIQTLENCQNCGKTKMKKGLHLASTHFTTIGFGSIRLKLNYCLI